MDQKILESRIEFVPAPFCAMEVTAESITSMDANELKFIVNVDSDQTILL